MSKNDKRLYILKIKSKVGNTNMVKRKKWKG